MEREIFVYTSMEIWKEEREHKEPRSDKLPNRIATSYKRIPSAGKPKNCTVTLELVSCLHFCKWPPPPIQVARCISYIVKKFSQEDICHTPMVLVLLHRREDALRLGIFISYHAKAQLSPLPCLPLAHIALSSTRPQHHYVIMNRPSLQEACMGNCSPSTK